MRNATAWVQQHLLYHGCAQPPLQLSTRTPRLRMTTARSRHPHHRRARSRDDDDVNSSQRAIGTARVLVGSDNGWQLPLRLQQQRPSSIRTTLATLTTPAMVVNKARLLQLQCVGFGNPVGWVLPTTLT